MVDGGTPCSPSSTVQNWLRIAGKLYYFGASPVNILRDRLTGAYTRDALQQRLGEEIVRSIRYELSLALLMIDLDHFKSINDAFGHARGDQALAHFAACAHEVLRRSDLLFRYGGDEFVVLLPNTPKLGAVTIAERLLEIVRSTPVPGDPPITLTLSIGVADMAEGPVTAEDLFERADRRLYAAKRAGRDRVVAESLVNENRLRFDSDSRLIERDLALEHARRFLSDLVLHHHGVAVIGGPPGAGRSRMLAELCKLACLQGYVIWSLATGPGLHMRAFGALRESILPWPDLPIVGASTEQLASALRAHVQQSGAVGLIIAIDRLVDSDSSTLSLLRDLLLSASVPNMAIAFTADSPKIPPSLAVLHQASIEIGPWSLMATHLWLRVALKWEPSEELSSWLHQAAEGLPERLSELLQRLVDRQLLTATARGWQLHGDLRSLVLEQPAKWPGLPLSASPGEFIDRENELRTLKGMVGEHAVVTIVGPGGMGKSRLALQVAWELSDQFAHGAYLIDLAPVSGVEFIFPALALALHIPLSGVNLPEAQVLHYLGGRAVLLVLDNFEHLLEGISIVSAIIRAAPQVRLLITSRERLNLAGEIVYPLGGLTLPALLEGSSLLQLFVQSARRSQSDFAPAERDLPFIAKIAQQVGGMPLGIELAAAWAPFLGCEFVAESLGHSLDILSAGQQDLPERQRGMRAVFEAFWAQLMPDEQRALAMLSVFRGGFRSREAEQVTGAKTFFLSALVSRAVLSYDERGRMVLHELLRQYAEEQLKAAAEGALEARRAHVASYLALAEQAAIGLFGPEQHHWCERMDEELDNFRAALGWALAIRPALALRLSSALSDYWKFRGYFREGSRWVEAALEAAGDTASADLLARALGAAAMFHERLGDYGLAAWCYRRALDLARTVGDSPLTARLLNEFGWMLCRRGDTAEARELAIEALALAQDTGDKRRASTVLRLLGSLSSDSKDMAAAVSYGEESLALSREIGHTDMIASALNSLGVYACIERRFAQAADYLNEALMLRQALLHPQPVAMCLNNLATVEYGRGDYLAAERYAQQSLAIYREIGERVFSTYAEVWLGMIAAAQGDDIGAQHWFTTGMAHSLTVGLIPIGLRALSGLAGVARRVGDDERAAALVGFALAHPSANSSVRDMAEPLLAELQAHMHATQLEVALARGRNLTLEAAITLGHMEVP